MDEVGLFTIRFNSVFNTFSLPSVSDTEIYATHPDSKQISAIVFKRTFCFAEKVKDTLKLKPDVNPVFRPKCRSPYAALYIEKELDCLQQL